MKGGQDQQLVPGSVNTKQARNKKHLANPALQQIELRSCVIFSGVNIENSFRKALFFCEPSVATNRAAKLCDFSGVNIEDSFRKALIFDNGT
jgi:hypothetical protein